MKLVRLAILPFILGFGACTHKDAGSAPKVRKFPLPDDVVFMGDQTVGGVHFQWKAVAEPKRSRERLGWLGQSGAATMYSTLVGAAGRRTAPRLHRVYWEKKAHTYFGYDLAAERSDSEGNCRVGVAPLSASLAEIGGAGIDAKSFTPIPLQTYPETQVVRSGDTISLVLLTSPDRSIRVVDYVQVSCKDAPLYAVAETAAKEGAPPRDISVEDIEMRVVDPQITINGNHLDAVVLHGSNAGPVVWFHIPGKGRILLSLARYRGFAKGGTVTGSAISFQHGGDRYEIDSSQPLFQSPRTWNLYVRTDVSYRTGGEAAFGSADRPENVR